MARKKRQSAYRRPDHFSKKAKEEGYAARSVYKLTEIQKRTRLLGPGMRVVDLGCFPGSWSKYAIERIGRGGRLVGVDFQAPELPGTFLPRSVYDVTADEITEALGGRADVVLSDMAPKTRGTRMADHYAQVELVRRALEVAAQVLRPGGGFVCKVFEGPDAQVVQAETKALFRHVRRIRPEAVRKESREWFLVGQDFKGAVAASEGGEAPDPAMDPASEPATDPANQQD